ncbi:hypothetical protein [Cytobacillus firmus]|uniref:hypothetical protein n=1 Tax=Cytobacillus firmus TaxID=1399 RepID=UPI0018CDE62B|nr:hypothetical protein [Cytobacillus firmus]MBG9654520.1 hypothetical protein [Cytobacillus firmus]MED1905661.1 hypothetical protein [Cytobacillus firmus]
MLSMIGLLGGIGLLIYLTMRGMNLLLAAPKIATMKLTSQAAYGEVPRNSIGIQFWISGEPADVWHSDTGG